MTLPEAKEDFGAQDLDACLLPTKRLSVSSASTLSDGKV